MRFFQHFPRFFALSFFLLKIFSKKVFRFLFLWYNAFTTIKRLFNRLTLLKVKIMKKHIHLPHDHGNQTCDFVASMPEQETFDGVAATFDLLSDPTRVKILWLLCHTEDCVANIAASVEMSSPAVSHHLRVLKQAGLLAHRKSGKEVYYTLADTDEARQIHHIVDIIFNLNCKERY